MELGMSCHAIEMPLDKLAEPLEMLVSSSLTEFYDLLELCLHLIDCAGLVGKPDLLLHHVCGELMILACRRLMLHLLLQSAFILII